jgi:hypothetical protein
MLDEMILPGGRGQRYCETLPERVTREAQLAKSGEILTDMRLFFEKLQNRAFCLIYELGFLRFFYRQKDLQSE